MTERPEVPVEPQKEMLEPDTFWELIEKLLLHSSRDEQKRIRHNTSLSALCRGYALPRLPRDKKTPQTEMPKYLKSNKVRDNLSATKTKTDSSSKKTDDNPKPRTRLNPDHDSNAQPSKSECKISDLDIIFLSDPDVPKSEQLWRFALRNRKQRENDTYKNDLIPVPSARSNEAIYEGLRKRLEDAKKEKDEKHTDTKPSKTKQKRKTRSIKKNQCKDKMKKGQISVEIKQVKNRSNSFSNGSVSPAGVAESPMVGQNANSSDLVHDLRRTPVHNLINTSENTHSHPTAEHFESKKSLYDSVLKKRLNCGNQLERFNRDIVCKNMNPRTVLGRDTTRKYMELKMDYLNLCCQESSLRHQIAMLQAEIFMMQHKGFHKRPVTVKTITLDSNSAHVPPKAEKSYTENNRSNKEKVLLFPRLKPSRPRKIPQQRSFEQFCESMMKKSGIQRETSCRSQRTDSSDKCSSTGLTCIDKDMPLKGVCSAYSLTTPMTSPPRR